MKSKCPNKKKLGHPAASLSPSRFEPFQDGRPEPPPFS
jgi:hypothetical protein